MALEYALRAFGDDFDYMLLFEDDAVPHVNATWPGVGGPNHLDEHLDQLERVNGAALFLGGSTFKGYDPETVMRLAAAPLGGVVRATMGDGVYAYALPRRAMPMVVARLRSNLNSTHMNGVADPYKLATDYVLWVELEAMANRSRGNSSNINGGYVSTPLLADHRDGTSHTWKHNPSKAHAYASWQGSPEWWRFTKP